MNRLHQQIDERSVFGLSRECGRAEHQRGERQQRAEHDLALQHGEEASLFGGRVGDCPKEHGDHGR